MPTVFGPLNQKFFSLVDDTWDESPFVCDSKTFGEALSAYATHYELSITPYDGSDPLIPFAANEEPKYFYCKAKSGTQTFPSLTDIHVLRYGEEICPKQNLQFELLPDDIIEFGILVC